MEFVKYTSKDFILRHTIVLVKVNRSHKVYLLEIMPYSKCKVLNKYTHNGHIGNKEQTNYFKSKGKMNRFVGG